MSFNSDQNSEGQKDSDTDPKQGSRKKLGWVPSNEDSDDFFSGERSYSNNSFGEDSRSDSNVNKKEVWPERKSKKNQVPISKPISGSTPKSPSESDDLFNQDLKSFDLGTSPELLPTPTRAQSLDSTQNRLPEMPDKSLVLTQNNYVTNHNYPLTDDLQTINLPEHGTEENIDIPPSISRSLIEWVIVILGAVLLAFLIRAFLVQAFWIPSPSMNDTLKTGDRILVNKVNYRISDISRLDVVVFHNPNEDDENKELVKRVIGLPGETVELREGEVFIDGIPLGDEPHVADGNRDNKDFSKVTIPDDSYFMLGDNRIDSKDSRSPSVGFISEDLIVGKAFVKFWPPSRMGRVQ